ncbi:beta-galactosidase, partial [Chitinophaga sancti]|uniref:beta-galactosidase n=1 Tax=Chitinophaga sancti TaxID=1004 RepID=UPI003F7B0D11
MVKFLLMLMFSFLPCIGKAQALLMHGEKEGGGVKSYSIPDLPVLPVLAGEVGNSSASSLSYMSAIWTKAKAMHFNTVLVPVYWELLEPAEGNFDFMLVDSLIYQARANDLHLVLLWFGTWKNSMSCYAPAWVKKDIKRFPRAGAELEILSAFEENNVQADIRAFTALMRRVKQLDAKERTVLMIQVENEIGMLGAPREYTAAANEAHAGQVPDALMRYLISHKDSLVPELRLHWGGQGYKMAGSWETVFGKSMATEELFQAWYYAVYANRVAGAGREVYVGSGSQVAFGSKEVDSGQV